MRRAFLILVVFFCLTSCGIPRTKSHFYYGDRSAPDNFAQKVAIQLCESDPSVRFDLMDALVENLSGAGIEVINLGNVTDMTGICEGGRLPESTRKHLRDNLGIQGLFVGLFEQKRVEPVLRTRFGLKLIGNPSGRLIWSTNIATNHLAAMANTKTIAAKAAAMAVESFRKDHLSKSE